MKKQRFCIILILCICLFSILINASAAGSIQAFINDSRWANGVSWTGNQTPKTNPSAQWWGCAAYCYDYVNYCYGYTNPRAGEAFNSVNEIRAGDVITVGNQSDGTGHWMVVVQRSGNSLYVAEGNYSGTVRIGWNYTISGSKFAEDSRNFTAGYHFLGEETVPNVPTPSISKNTFQVGDTITVSFGNWNNATYFEYYMSEFPEAFAYSTYTSHEVVYENSVTFSNLPAGRYNLLVHAGNSAGLSGRSDWVSFDVYEKDYIPVYRDNYNGHIYSVYDYEASWTFCKTLCEAMGGHLVTINSAEEGAFVNGLIQNGAKDAYWIGATNYSDSATNQDGTWRWVTGEAFSYKKWYNGEPSSTGTKGTREHWAEVRKSYSYSWNDTSNTNKSNKGFIIEVEPAESDITVRAQYNGHEYVLIDRNTTWSEAQGYCLSLGGQLVALNTSGEAAFIDSLIEQGTRSWYYVGGVRRNGEWRWLNGKADGAVISSIQWAGDLWPSHCNYLMKYKTTKKYINLPNTYYPEIDIKHIGFICEINDPVTTYTVTFKANGGSGSMSAQKVTGGTATTLTANKYTRSGFAFAGWNTKANGSGTAYADGASVTLTGDLTLYAQWRSTLSIQYASKTIQTDASFQFTATGGTGSYTWRVGDTTKATVDANGKVTGKSVGNTYLYCTDSAGTEVKCQLKITAAPLSIHYSEKTVKVNENFQFAATGGTGGYSWRTGNASVATVDNSGKVTGKAAGNTYLYCKDSAGTEVKCLLKITVDPLSIRYSEKTVKAGESFQFTATGGTGGYTWRTGNASVATVDNSGKVTGKAAGNTYLYCKDSSGVEVKCLLKVIAPLSIRYGEKIVMIGTPFQFTATGGTGGYTWRVGDTAKATVDTTGKVTGKTAGNTYLYCKDSAGTEVKCLLKVTAPVSIRYAEKTVNVGASFQFTATGGSGSYTWRTGNTSVATVDSSGKVTGKTAGNTYLYCRDSYGNEVKCLLKIK